MRIVALIPARRGSKGLKDKNIKCLGGKPLIGIAAEAAKGCADVTEVYLNSDDEDYLKLGQEYGAKPFMRPDDLANDTATMQSVVTHFAETLERRGEHYDALILLYPVYPFRTSEDLSNILQSYRNEASGRPLIGMKTPKTHPYLCYERDQHGGITNLMGIDENQYYRRQQYPNYFEITHWACVLPFARIKQANAQLLYSDSFGYLIEQDLHLVNIDTELDFMFAELLIQAGRFAV